jgi:hypothetical protein
MQKIKKVYTCPCKRLVATHSVVFFCLTIFFFLILLPVRSTMIENVGLHSLILFLICGLSIFTMLAAKKAYASSGDIRIMLLIFAFFIFAVVFFLHAIAAPSFHFVTEAFFDITEHFSLFFGALLLFIGSFFPIIKMNKYFYNRLKLVFILLSLLLLAFFSLLFFFPKLAHFTEAYINIPILLTGPLFFLAAVKLFRQYCLSPKKFLYKVILGSSILISTGIIPLFYTEWNALWWYFHLVILAGFTIMTIGVGDKWKEELGRAPITKNS